MISLAIASLVVNLITLIGLYYNYKAVQYTKEQIDLLKDENSERNTWASKHEQAFSLVLKTDAWFTLNGTHQNGYPVVFSDSAFRILVETYIISFDRSRDVMSPVFSMQRSLAFLRFRRRSTRQSKLLNASRTNTG